MYTKIFINFSIYNKRNNLTWKLKVVGKVYRFELQCTEYGELKTHINYLMKLLAEGTLPNLRFMHLMSHAQAYFGENLSDSLVSALYH